MRGAGAEQGLARHVRQRQAQILDAEQRRAHAARSAAARLASAHDASAASISRFSASTTSGRTGASELVGPIVAWRRRHQRARIGMGGRVEQRCDIRLLDDLAGIEDADALAYFRDDAEIMRDEQQCRAVAALHLGDQPQYLLLHGNVERGRRLVGDDQLRFGGESRGDQHALAHAAGEFMRIALEHARRLANMHLFEEAERARLGGRGVEAEDADEPVGHLGFDALGRIERGQRVLRDQRGADADEAASPGVAQREEVHAAEPHGAFDHFDRARQDAEDRAADHALARPALADQPMHLARRDR